jgi:hypothetical protein
MANWLDKYEQGGLVLKKKTKDNYGKRENANEGHSTASPGWIGEGTTNRGFNYNGAWGGTMEMGGSMPGAVGFTYARVAGSAPANGKYTKKTKASAQNGQEMKFYQEGLDFKPKSISQNGSAIKDDRGQWAYPGEITEIGSNDITMQGVDYPVLGVSDTGDTQMMYPDQDYKFDGKKVTEYPMAQNGDWLSKYATEPMRQDATRNVIPRKMTDKEKLEAVATSDQAQKRALNTAKEVIAERQKNKATKGDLNTPGSWHLEDKARLFPKSVGGVGEMIDEYINPATYVGVLADALGESVTARDPKGIALSLALSAGAGAMGLDPLGSAIKGVKAIPKATRAGLNAIDRNFSDVGQSLAYIEKEGLKKGLSSQRIKEKQMQYVGITSNQREAYVPGVSDFLSKYVTPVGYTGQQTSGQSKLMQTLDNIKKGKIDFQGFSESEPRQDSWNLYLGKPQKNYTFRVAETAPINHPAYSSEQLSKMDIYSLNEGPNSNIKPREFNLIEDPIPKYVDEAARDWESYETNNPILKNIKLLENNIVQDRHLPVMGGYNKRLNSTGLEYNDIWDLEPTIKNPISKKPMKVRIDNFIGKPFMSHGVFPEVTTESVSKNLNEVISKELEMATNRYKITKDKNNPQLFETPFYYNGEKATRDPYDNWLIWYNNLRNKPNEDIVRTSKDIKNLTKLKDRLKNIPKKEEGGWLNKYK